MISWIQHHLIRHGRWIFLSLLALIIVAFVFTIGNTPGCTTDRSGYEPNLFYGIDLNSPREREAVVQKVSISAFLNRQQFRSEDQFQSALSTRIALLHLADVIGIPAPDQPTLAEYIKTKPAFSGPDGQFSPDAYTRMLDDLESNPRMSEALVLQVLAEDFRLDQVRDVVAGPGYLLPSEAIAQTIRNQTELELIVASLSFAAFSPEIEADEATLRKYYEENSQRYEIPERIEASYVAFRADAYMDQVPEADEAALRQHFAENRAAIVAEYEATQAPATEAGPEEAATEKPAVTFETVRELVAASYAREQASRIANQAAQTFAFRLYRDEIKRDSATFNQLINQSGLSLTKIEPYTLAGARQRALSPELLESAFALGTHRYFSDPHPIDGGFAVLIFEGRIAPVIPPFEEVANAVNADFRAAEKRRLFSEKGVSLREELVAALAAGTAFSEATESLGLSTTAFEKFAVRNAPSNLNRSALEQAQGMAEGEVSPMLTSGGNGLFVYLQTKAVPELDRENEDVTQAKQMLQQWAMFSSGSSLMNELVDRGLPEAAE